jgi:hypothetical protein
MTGSQPPQQFGSFCTMFGVALYRDATRIPKSDFDAFVASAIEYGLDGWERQDLVVLRDFLTSVLAAPDGPAKMRTLWRNTHPRFDFFTGPDAPPDQPAIVQVFAKVLGAIQKKLR